MRRFRRLTKQDRVTIEAYTRTGMRASEIARRVGVHRATIYRELKRGAYVHTRRDGGQDVARYSADLAQGRYEAKWSGLGPELKIGKDRRLAAYIEAKIIEQHYSPAAVLGEIKARGMEFDTSFCVRTLYSYIDKGLFIRLTNKDLLIKGRRRRVYRHVRPKKPPRGRSIEERPAEVAQRDTFGHWEMDTVIGARGRSSSVLLVLTERLSRREIIRLLPDKSSGGVVGALDDIERQIGAAAFRQSFRSITCDNGSEFADQPGIERSVFGGERRTVAYSCHPYCSYERGSNENANRIIRRFIPKSYDLDRLTPERVAEVEAWMNALPRKILGWRSAADIYKEETGNFF